MASKRMFDHDIVNSDDFLDMSLSAQALYFHLGMNADDRGFVSPRKIMRMLGSSADDLRILILKNFVIAFESGVVVITHFNQNNWLDSRRIKETVHLEEFRQLTLTDQIYSLQNAMLSNRLANAKQMLRESSIEESRVEENSNTSTPHPLDAGRGSANAGKPKRNKPRKAMNPIFVKYDKIGKSPLCVEDLRAAYQDKEFIKTASEQLFTTEVVIRQVLTNIGRWISGTREKRYSLTKLMRVFMRDFETVQPASSLDDLVKQRDKLLAENPANAEEIEQQFDKLLAQAKGVAK